MFRKRSPQSLDPRAVVASLYVSLLGRHPVNQEEQDKVVYLQSGGVVEQVVGSILASRECELSYFSNPVFDSITAPDPLPFDVPRLYLWHLPKTGGTSLREMLRPHFDEIEFCGNLTLSHLYRMSRYRLLSFRVIAGHFGPTLPSLLPDVPLVTVTLVRDPVEMVVSHYLHWRDRGIDSDPLTQMTRSMPFDEWCRSEATSALWSNPQAAALCSERVPPNRQEARISPEGATIAVPEDELLERATATLDRIDITGTTEQILDVYRACVQRLGLTPRYSEPLKENVGSEMETPVSPSTRDWLLEHNAVDAQLFSNVRSRTARP